MNEIILLFLTTTGLAISTYIYHHKTHNKKIVCFSKKDCMKVINSKYGKTFGIENTLLGILYYSLLLIYSIVMIYNTNLFKANLYYHFLVIISSIAALFSIYLIGIQKFVLKKWCDYCLLTAAINIIILMVI